MPSEYQITYTGTTLQHILDDVQDIRQDSSHAKEYAAGSLGAWIKYVVANDPAKINYIRVKGQDTDLPVSGQRVIIPAGAEYTAGTTTKALKFKRMTQAEYNALAVKDSDTLYIIVG